MTMTKRMFSLVCFEGEGQEDTSNQNAQPEVKFTQEDLNKFLAEDRRKHQEKYKQLESSYQNILAVKGIGEEERNKLRVEFEDLQKTYRTKEQQMEFEKKQAALKYEAEMKSANEKAAHYESLYKNQVVDTSLTNAAVSGDAYQPAQIVSLLRPLTELRPQVDKDGRETGALVPMINLPDIDEKTGERITTLRTPEDAVKRMRELPKEYGNLFKSNVVSGVGQGTGTGQMPTGGKIDVTKLTSEQYRKIRAENPELLGLPRRPNLARK